MLLRISLFVAILAGLAAGGLGYYEVTNQIPALTAQRDTENTAKKDALTKLATTEKNLKKTQSELAQTQSELSDTKGERDKAVARAEAQSKLAGEIADKLAKAVADRDEAQNQLAAYKASDLTPDQVVRLNKTLKEAQAQIDAITAEKRFFERQLAATKARLLKYEGEDNFVKLKADLKGKIIDVDPKWDFVVLNIGDIQGAVQDGELLVSRDGKLVAKIIISRVEKDYCIANLVPGWKLGEMIEGDEVSPAHPAPAT
jgi:hypothetical protein